MRERLPFWCPPTSNNHKKFWKYSAFCPRETDSRKIHLKISDSGCGLLESTPHSSVSCIELLKQGSPEQNQPERISTWRIEQWQDRQSWSYQSKSISTLLISSRHRLVCCCCRRRFIPFSGRVLWTNSVLFICFETMMDETLFLMQFLAQTDEGEKLFLCGAKFELGPSCRSRLSFSNLGQQNAENIAFLQKTWFQKYKITPQCFRCDDWSPQGKGKVQNKKTSISMKRDFHWHHERKILQFAICEYIIPPEGARYCELEWLGLIHTAREAAREATRDANCLL